MKKLNLQDVSHYVEENIGTFHQKRIQSLDSLKLSNVLKRKNPYLFKAKYVLTADEIVRGIVDAHISSNEETTFGDWMEGLARFICKQIFEEEKKAWGSAIDLHFQRDDIQYFISIKSGPNWGNKSQKEKMALDFSDVKKSLSTSGYKANIVFINGCCYGRDNRPHKFPKKGTDYLKLCGQRFWEFISGDTNLYTEIIEPLGHRAKEKNDDFIKSYSKMINKFTLEFAQEFCKENGEIEWDKLVRFNSGTLQPKKKRTNA